MNVINIILLLFYSIILEIRKQNLRDTSENLLNFQFWKIFISTFVTWLFAFLQFSIHILVQQPSKAENATSGRSRAYKHWF